MANIDPNDIYLEPSAGVGGLAALGRAFGPKEVNVNELSDRRRGLLEALKFDNVFSENAEQLHNILPAKIKPTVVVNVSALPVPIRVRPG